MSMAAAAAGTDCKSIWRKCLSKPLQRGSRRIPRRQRAYPLTASSAVTPRTEPNTNAYILQVDARISRDIAIPVGIQIGAIPVSANDSCAVNTERHKAVKPLSINDERSKKNNTLTSADLFGS